jgi:Predicted amino acid aldolase or racemase
MTKIGMSIDELETPCMLVDLDKLEANIAKWQATIAANGVALRPHVKTHKVPEIGQMQIAAGAAGITVAKISEAEVFAEGGINDIFVAYPTIGASKWKRAAELARSITLTVGVDSLVGIEGLSAAAQEAGSTIRVRVEVDTGLNRSGVQPGEAEALCRAVLAAPNLELDGLFTFRGPNFPGANGRSADELGREEGQIMVDLAEELRSSGIPIKQISVGGTPTSRAAATVPGVTEVRPGTYVFSDWMMTAGGVVSEDEVALQILCTVVSRPAPDKATVDGGSKTFSGDSIPAKNGVPGYARAVGYDAYVETMSEEHGVLRLGEGVDLKIGQRIGFHPLHVCPTVNLSDELIGVRNGVVEKVWPILARGKRS